ncbi:aluminum induced protein with YGL and LRDR motifs [Zea mays]|uniref:Aluminum induced protein with YGL and LRDR motifs n=1 Tax=Zea mays TaxID=4577 RepID=A0A1D6L3U5_MAIZE|nr:aluminum induced protein with YGL and LRDR motifs [Zea mays]
MLAVFDPTVAKCPEGLRSPPVAGAAAGAGGAGAGALMKGFSDSHDGAVTVSLGPSGALAYSAANQSPLVPSLLGIANGLGFDQCCGCFPRRFEEIFLAFCVQKQLGKKKEDSEFSVHLKSHDTVIYTLYTFRMHHHAICAEKVNLWKELSQTGFFMEFLLNKTILTEKNASQHIHTSQIVIDPESSSVILLFGAVNDIFCLFQGHIENIANLKQHYGLSKTANEVTILIEAYRTLRDRGPVPASQVVRDLSGKFAFILYDTLSKSTFVAADADGSIPFFWGVDYENHLVFSDDVGILKTGCGNSYAPFPKGCFYTTSGGLQSFEHPLHEVKAVPRVDSQGQMCGSIFKVDSESKKKQDASIPRVGSAADWSNQF